MRTQETSPLYHRAGSFDEVVALYAKQMPKLYTKYTRQVNTKNRSYIVGSQSSFGPAPIFNEGDDMPVRDFETPYRIERIIRQRGMVFVASTLSLESDFYGIIGERSKLLTKSIYDSVEYDMAEFINLATSSVTSIDSVSLANAAHPLASGSASNILTGNPVLSVTSLAEAKQTLYATVDHNGDPMILQGRYILAVHPDNQDLAYRLTESERLATTDVNDPNWAGMGVTVVCNPYFSNPLAWALIIDGEDNPLEMVVRRGLITRDNLKGSDQLVYRDSYAFSGNMTWTKNAKDWRGFVYSSGAGT